MPCDNCSHRNKYDSDASISCTKDSSELYSLYIFKILFCILQLGDLLAVFFAFNRWHADFQNYTKFMIVRHPFDRLLSAYYNILYYQSGMFGPAWMPNYLHHVFHADSVNETLFTLEYFLRLVTDPGWFGYLDRHWTPYTDLCDPCSIEYDYVLRLETLEQDAVPVLKALGLKEGFNIGTENRETRLGDDIPIKKGLGSLHLSEYGGITEPLMRNVTYRYRLDFEKFGYMFDSGSGIAGCRVDTGEGLMCC